MSRYYNKEKTTRSMLVMESRANHSKNCLVSLTIVDADDSSKQKEQFKNRRICLRRPKRKEHMISIATEVANFYNASY